MSKSIPHFGDMVRNTAASKHNPHRDGYFVETITRYGRLNPGKWYKITDGRGGFWLTSPERTEVLRKKAGRTGVSADAIRAEMEKMPEVKP